MNEAVLQDDTKRSANVGRGLMMLVAISLIIMGGLFITLMARSCSRAKQMRDWPVVSCLVLESTIEERLHDSYSPPEFSHRITYGYEWNGDALTSDRISLRGRKWSSKRHEVDRSIANYPAGSQQRCHIKPDNPRLAVLELDSMAPLYSIWFPALFVVGGIGMLITCFRSRTAS